MVESHFRIEAEFLGRIASEMTNSFSCKTFAFHEGYEKTPILHRKSFPQIKRTGKEKERNF